MPDKAAPDPNDEQEDTEVKNLTPDDIFFLRIRDALQSFAGRQNEILRLAEFMSNRAAEIDNAKERARALISAQLDHVDETAIDQMVALFTELNEADLGDDDLSPEDRHDAIAKALEEVAETLPDGLMSTYMDGTIRAIHAPPGVGILRSSLLVNLVGELEMLVSHLARACFERLPSAFEDSGRSFTWNEISAHESIDHFRDHVVDRAIDDVLRGSLTDWTDYFVKKFKIPPIKEAGTFLAQEAIQRRHCIVHNAGLTSALYLERLAKFDPDAEVGDALDVSSDYLREAADTLHMVAFSLCWALGFKIISEPEAKEHLGSFLANRCYYLLLDRRYPLIRRIGGSAPLDLIDEGSAFVMRVNYWLAHKLDGKFDQVRAEVAALDVATRSRDFNLAKHSLLDEDKAAFQVAKSMIRDGALRPEHFFTWPLLAGVREHARRNSESEPLEFPPRKQLE